jgi:hypothetical protein
MSNIAAPLPPALAVLASLPRDRLELLAEVVITLLDATSPDPDREFDADGCCEAGDDGSGFTWGNPHAGDSEDDEPDDAREDDDPRESDNEDCCAAGDDRIEAAPVFHACDDEDREPQDENGTGEMYPFAGRAQPGEVIQFPRARRS